ncbi:MAG: glycosyltransferase family 4 protein [Kiritimatiellae bacterium]|nr:glycosyltransferase family 4 protein [Kiritimatiellia bacterium]
MKILWIDVVSEMGGAQYSLLDACRKLVAYPDLEIAVALPHGPLFSHLSDAGITCFPIEPIRARRRGKGLFSTLAKFFRAPSAIHKIIRAFRPDILHANALPSLLTIRKERKIPIFWHVRDLRQPYPLFREGAYLATRIIAASQSIEEHLVESVSSKTFSRIKLVRNGIDTDRYVPRDNRAARDRFGLPQDVPLVGMVAHFIPWKRHDLFLETAALVHARIPEAHFVLAGQDLFHENAAYINTLHKQAETLGIADRVHFIGDCQATETLFPAFTVLLHPPVGEPFGRVICEALACQVPVVAAASAGPEEIIAGTNSQAGNTGHPGILCERKTPEDFADAVCKLIEEPQTRTQMGTMGRQVVCERYSISRVAEELHKLYQTTLHEIAEDLRRATNSDS